MLYEMLRTPRSWTLSAGSMKCAPLSVQLQPESLYLHLPVA